MSDYQPLRCNLKRQIKYWIILDETKLVYCFCGYQNCKTETLLSSCIKRHWKFTRTPYWKCLECYEFERSIISNKFRKSLWSLLNLKDFSQIIEEKKQRLTKEKIRRTIQDLSWKLVIDLNAGTTSLMHCIILVHGNFYSICASFPFIQKSSSSSIPLATNVDQNICLYFLFMTRPPNFLATFFGFYFASNLISLVLMSTVYCELYW